jgi:hypothetical protein
VNNNTLSQSDTSLNNLRAASISVTPIPPAVKNTSNKRPYDVGMEARKGRAFRSRKRQILSPDEDAMLSPDHIIRAGITSEHVGQAQYEYSSALEPLNNPFAALPA